MEGRKAAVTIRTRTPTIKTGLVVAESIEPAPNRKDAYLKYSSPASPYTKFPDPTASSAQRKFSSVPRSVLPPSSTHARGQLDEYNNPRKHPRNDDEAVAAVNKSMDGATQEEVNGGSGGNSSRNSNGGHDQAVRPMAVPRLPKFRDREQKPNAPTKGPIVMVNANADDEISRRYSRPLVTKAIATVINPKSGLMECVSEHENQAPTSITSTTTSSVRAPLPLHLQYNVKNLTATPEAETPKPKVSEKGTTVSSQYKKRKQSGWVVGHLAAYEGSFSAETYSNDLDSDTAKDEDQEFWDEQDANGNADEEWDVVEDELAEQDWEVVSVD